MSITHQLSVDEDKTLTNETDIHNHLGEQFDNSSDEHHYKQILSSPCEPHMKNLAPSGTQVHDGGGNSNAPLMAKVIVDLSQTFEVDTDNVSNLLTCVDLNDVVQIEKEVDNDWLMAKSEQATGLIKRQSCLILDGAVPIELCKYLVDNGLFNLHVCFASFVAQDVGDLSLTKGDIIIALNQDNEHWMRGQVCYDGQSNSWPKLCIGEQSGAFPLNHCWQFDVKRVELLCRNRIEKSSPQEQAANTWPENPSNELGCPPSALNKHSLALTAHSSSISSHSSSACSASENQNMASKQYSYNHHDTTDNSSQNSNNYNNNNYYRTSQSNYSIHEVPQNKPPPRPNQLPSNHSSESFSARRQKSASEQAVVRLQNASSRSIMSVKQQDKLKSWIHTVRKKTARLTTRITASLGLISLQRDEEFERHHENFKQLEKTIRIFIKNVSSFVEHFESFLMALQLTSDHLSDFYRDKPQHQKELAELKRKNKALHCEHFHAFKRTVDRQVIAVSSQILQKFSGPHQLISKRSSKFLDYITKTKDMEACRDLEKRAALRDQYVIAKDLYDRINSQLIHELPLFNQYVMDIFRECVLVLLESRRNLIMSYTKQTANLLDTPLMTSYTASEVASSILMSCNELMPKNQGTNDWGSKPLGITLVNSNDKRVIGEQGIDAKTNGNAEFDVVSADEDGPTARPKSAMSQLSSEFDQLNDVVRREISSTPLSQVSGPLNDSSESATNGVDEPDFADAATRRNGDRNFQVDISRISSSSTANNRQNENIESRLEVNNSKASNLGSTPPDPPKLQAVADSDLDDNTIKELRDHLGSNNNNNNSSSRGKKKNKKSYPIYIASWPFLASGPNQLTIACNQHLKLIEDSDECGNSDWSLVKDKKGRMGYVPSSYIRRRD